MKDLNNSGKDMRALNTLFKIIICLILLTSQSYSFVDYQLLQKNTSMILLIGDTQHEQLNNMNTAHIEWFFQALDFFKAYDPIKITYEMSDETARLLRQQTLPSNLGITFFYLNKIAELAEASTNIKIAPFDCRTKKNEIIEDFFANLGSFFAKPQSFKQWKKTKRKQNKRIQKSIYSLDTTQFLESLNIQEHTIKQWQNTFSPDSLEYSLFTDLLHKYKDNSTKLSNILKEKPNIDIRENILGLFEHCTTVTGLKNKFLELTRLFCLNTDYIFADLGFLNTILQSIQEGFSKNIIIVGWAHKKNISAFLSNLGYEVMSEFSIIQDNGLENRSIVKCDLMDLPDKLLPDLHRLFNTKEEVISQQQIMEQIKAAKTEVRYCRQCKTLETKEQQLSACSRCKQACYCNRECQKQHWSQHKLECKK